MSSQMSSVYSGGLMYEYSVEENEFGVVTLKGDTVTKSKEYTLFKDALAKYKTPTGDGGASKTTHAAKCPPSDAAWKVDPSLVPAMPKEAEKYMKAGAGKGPGLEGDGSQNAGDSGTATASVTGGQASATGKGGDEDNAGVSTHGSFDKAPLIVSGLAVFFTLFGTLLL